MRALVPLVEQIVAIDSKVIVLSQFQARGLERLQSVLEPYGVLRISKDTSDEERRTILQSFRAQAHWHVLLLESGAKTDGEPLVEASYIIHFDHAWNPALRMRTELKLHPAIFRAIPITIYEFWVAGTVDQALFYPAGREEPASDRHRRRHPAQGLGRPDQAGGVVAGCPPGWSG